MTYLEAVNKVLVRLREDKVTSVDQTSYSELIGEFVNDALRQVEDAWDWSALRTTSTVTTEQGVFNYILTGTQNNVKVLDVVNDTKNYFIDYKNAHWMNHVFLNQDPDEGSPRFYSFNGVDGNGDTQVDLYPIPDGAYQIRFNIIKRTKQLVNDLDEITVPEQPVLHLAQAIAVRERGESGAQSAPELFFTANRTLSDAIALDAVKHPEETIFYMV